MFRKILKRSLNTETSLAYTPCALASLTDDTARTLAASLGNNSCIDIATLDTPLSTISLTLLI